MSAESAVGAPKTSEVERDRVVLRSRRGWQPLDIAELWRYRELLWILALRDIKVRYKQTVLGAAWAVIQPLVTMFVFTIIARFGKIPTDGVQPQVFYYCGMLPWLLFANSVSNASNSLVGNQNLITKVYFPRLAIPIATIVTSLVDFAIAFLMLIVIMLWYRVAPVPQIALLPVFVLLALMAALAGGLWLSALNVEFRDVRYVIPFLLQLWLFCTPVLYSTSGVHDPWKRLLLGLNPMSGVVEGFRWCVFGGPPPGSNVVVSVVAICTMLVGSLFYFRRVEQTFADRV